MLAHAVLILAQLSGSGSFSGVGGINGYPVPATVISAVSETADANTVDLKWTTDIASDSRGFCGSKQALDSGAAAASTSHEIIVAGLTPSTGYSCTVQSGSSTQTIAATTAALATSTPITGLSYGSWTDYNATSPPHTMTGDTYYNCNAGGTTYLTTMDTSGWNGLPNFSASLMLAKFTSESPIVGADINLLTGYLGSNQTTDAKASGVFCMGGNWFVAMNRIDGSGGCGGGVYECITSGSLFYTTNHGTTVNNLQSLTTFTTTGKELTPWKTTLWTQPVSFTNWASNHFVMYGADDGTLGYTVAANRFNDGNAYVYIVSLGHAGAAGIGLSSVCNNDSAYLMRIPRIKLAALHASDYQYYVSGDGNLDSNWSNTASSAGAILTNSGKLGWMSIQYIPTLNRYLMGTFYYTSGASNPANSVQLGYESPTPWGPWTLIATNTFTGTGYYSPIILQDSALAATFGTTTVTLTSTQNFQSISHYNLFYNTMTVTH